MTAPRNAHQDASGRFYTWRNERYWSVTTILQAVPKYALVPWTAKAVAEYACDNIETVQTLLANDDREAAVDLLKRATDRYRDKKAELGSNVHFACEAFALGKPMPPWPLEIKRHMEHFSDFLETYRPTIIAAEASVYNRTERYAGTLDLIGGFTNPKRKLIVDVKTGKNVYPEVGLQLAMYRFAEFIGLPDGSQRKMPEVDGCAVLHLTEDGYDFREVEADDNIWRAALYVREVFRFQSETAKHVLGPTIKPPRKRKALSEPEEPRLLGRDEHQSPNEPEKDTLPGSESAEQTTLLPSGPRTKEQEEVLGVDIYGAPV